MNTEATTEQRAHEYLTCLAWGEGHGVYGLTLAPAAVAE